MKLQKGLLNCHKQVFILLDDNYIPVQPVQKYIRYLDSLERSPNTIATYARSLKLYWEFLRDNHLDWQSVKVENLAEFIFWLRSPDPSVVSLQQQEAIRCEKTVNLILTVVGGFYDFHHRLGTFEGVENFYLYQLQNRSKYKPFLHHITKSRTVRSKLLKLKEPKKIIGCLKVEEIKALIEACNTLRDKFLVRLLYETGLRIGELLGLRLSDIHTAKLEISVIQRVDNINAARAKSSNRSISQRIVHVNTEILKYFSAYLIDEYPEDLDCDYVFVVLPRLGKDIKARPLAYSAVDSLFRRLRKKTGIQVTPHLLRHTHATELVRNGWKMAYVQKRLGHSDIQTTINTYTHLSDEDLRVEYNKYLTRSNFYND